jgi:hypothetical protein
MRKFKDKHSFKWALSKTEALKGNKNYDKFVKLLGEKTDYESPSDRKLTEVTAKQLIKIFELVAKL